VPTKHGLRHTTEYTSWASMKGRCLNKNNPKYDRYGGRGIQVCDAWINDFGRFIADMGLKPSPKHSIDRIDNDGNYEASNCRWAIASTQSNNRSTTRIFCYKRMKGTLRSFAMHYGVPYKLLKSRLEAGWTLDRAIEEPVGADLRLLTYQGRTQSMSAWGREVGISGACISERVRAGWDTKYVLTCPPKKNNS